MGLSVFPFPTASGFPFNYIPITTSGTVTLQTTITRGVYTLTLDASQTVNIQFQNASGYRVSATIRGGSGYVSLPFDVTALVLPGGATYPLTLGYALTTYTQASAPTGTWAWQASGTVVSSPNFTGALTSSLGAGATGYQVLWSDGNSFDSSNTTSPSGQITAYPVVQQAGVSRNFLLVAKDANGVLSAASSVLSTGNSNSQTLVVTFTGSGSWTSPSSVSSIDCLVVGGGGAGANNGSGNQPRGVGGGGAGGFRNLTGVSVTPSTTYAITVGAGAPYGVTVFENNNGNPSSIGSVVIGAAGGGGAANGAAGRAGGSGGGAGQTASGGAGNTPSTTPSQGNKGGDSTGTGGAGGGGAGAAGANTAGVSAGGAGAVSTITGSSVTYAGGGGGAGGGIGSSGGSGGGGTGRADANADSGTANTGGGGGGASNWNNSSTFAGGNGGSGIVIIRYSA